MKINLEELRQFLITANQVGYSATGESGTKKEADGSKTISFKQTDWQYHDNYFGGEPFGGRSVIIYKEKPVWIMVYYGAIAKGITNFEIIYDFLRKALAKAPPEHPYRGPELFQENEFEYINKWEGKIEGFNGIETITHKGEPIYQAKYQGGVVNVRED